jgi:Golgi apparatus protein 1
MQVAKYQELAAQDIRMDVPLADACYEDRVSYCSAVPPVRAEVQYIGTACVVLNDV